MSENLKIASGNKDDKYQLLYRQILQLSEVEKDPVALMANVSSMIHYTFNFLWTGFYRVSDRELVLGPFQGPPACMRIPYGKGVCGKAWEYGKTIIVPDVDSFPGHIACSSDSRSEIVVPIKNNKSVTGVIDIDSDRLSTFDETDALWLERIASSLISVQLSIK